MDLNQNPDGSITVQATQYDITFEASTEKADEPQILIPKNCPIPIRKSHLIPATSEEISVKLFLRNGEKSTELAEVSVSNFLDYFSNNVLTKLLCTFAVTFNEFGKRC